MNYAALGNIMKLSDAETRSITAENVYGEKGKGGMAEVSAKPQPEVVKIGQKWKWNKRCLGRTWKIRPCITLSAESATTIMDVSGPGVIQHVWITLADARYRDVIVRMYWDGEKSPSVEAPVGDFFCNGWKKRANVLALPINVNPSGGFNCYFPMPFRKRARITVENRAQEDIDGFYYTVNYSLIPVARDNAYFHAQFRRVNRLAYKKDYVILDGVKGRGHYVGTYLAWQQNSPGWWGEGEFKVFIDGDRDFPTICGTGTEDYFGGAWGFGQTFSAPFLGYPLGVCDFKVGRRHGLYRFHIMDPIRFKKDLKVTIQALGWDDSRPLPLQDDIASVAYWYQTEPHVPFPHLPNREQMEVITPDAWRRSDFLEHWRVSKLLPKGKGVASAPAIAHKKTLRWMPLKARLGFVNVHPLYNRADGIVYLAADINARRNGQWTLLIGHDGGVRVFVDGRPVLTEAARINPAVPDRSEADIRLSKGRHHLLVALDIDQGLGWGIFARFEYPGEERKPGMNPKFPECVEC